MIKLFLHSNHISCLFYLTLTQIELLKLIMLISYHRDLQLSNVKIIVADISKFEMEASFDRIISIEMFEVCKFCYFFLVFYKAQVSNPIILFSTWRTIRYFSRRYPCGWSRIVSYSFITSATKYLPTILRYLFFAHLFLYERCTNFASVLWYKFLQWLYKNWLRMFLWRKSFLYNSSSILVEEQVSISSDISVLFKILSMACTF